MFDRVCVLDVCDRVCVCVCVREPAYGEYADIRCVCVCVCANNEAEERNHSSSRGTKKTPGQHFKYLALFWTTHICQTSAKQRGRGGEDWEGGTSPLFVRRRRKESYSEWK